ncbi:MAG: dockerin type I repeat-containing protein [Clostridia bacterium]|nr:dockerin type I repeat-containing protein [Clostridia bacterium]
MRKSNKILAVLLALVMLLASVPVMTAMAGDEHVHIYKVYGETVEPTCVTKGYTVYKCACGDTKTSYTAELGHDLMGSYIKGEETHAKYCDRCKLQIAEPHNWDEENVKVTTEATCKATGEGEVKCKDCGEKKTITLDKAEHKFDSIVGTEMNHKYVCTVCKASIEQTHKWDDGVVTTKPQCSAKGVKTFTCKYCGETKTSEINAEHTLPEKATSVDDKQHAYTCAVTGCGYAKKEAHKFVVVEGKKSLCDESVALTITCEGCNYKVVTAVTEHDFADVTKYDADNHKQTCKNCNTSIVAAHDWKDVKVTKAATCKEVGEKEVKCACGETKTVEIPKLEEHKWDAGTVTKEANCGEKGVKTFKCTVCETTKTEEIATVGEHTWGEWEVTVPATPLLKGTKTRECSVCGAKESEKFEYKEETDEFLAGDVNDDGEVTALDARLVLQHVAGLRTLNEDEFKAANMNEDNEVTALDARIILQIVAGLIK